jgi:hypothetical protein
MIFSFELKSSQILTQRSHLASNFGRLAQIAMVRQEAESRTFS